MFYVINYYKKLEIRGFKGEKAVFVASDDPNAIQELRDKYKDFIFKDKSFYFNKSEIDDTKYTANNLLHTIFDIHSLSTVMLNARAFGARYRARASSVLILQSVSALERLTPERRAPSAKF
jgi:hypothetical protein